MENKHLNTGRAVSMPVGLGIGGFISLAVTLGSTALISKLIDVEMIPFESVGYTIMAVLLAGSFLGAETAYCKVRRRKLLICVLSGIVYLSILLSITALFFGGQYEAIGVTSGLVMAGSISAGLLGHRKKEKGRGRKLKRGHR